MFEEVIATKPQVYLQYLLYKFTTDRQKTDKQDIYTEEENQQRVRTLKYFIFA